MRSVNFDNPYLLLIAIPLLLLVIIPFVIAIRKENRQKSAVISLVIHIAIVILVTLAAAGAKVTTVLTETNVYVVADVSYSSERELDLVDEYIDEIKDNLPRNTKLGVVCFGKDSVVLYKPGEEGRSVKEALVDNSATDIVSALEYTSGLYKDDVIKKMVLITDGRSTDPDSRGRLVAQMEALESKNITLDAIFVDSTISDEELEVQISDLQSVKKTYLSQRSEAKLLLQSNYEGQARVTLSVKAPNSDSYVEQPYTIEDITYGYNLIKLPLISDEAGVYDYRVSVTAESDICDKNNVYTFTQEVDESLDVLLVTEKQEDIDQITKLLGERATVTSVLVKMGKPVTNLPYTVEELSKYDEIILSNIDIRELPNVTSFMYAIELAVSQYGKSLTTIGNLELQNKDDSILGDLGEMLSINYGNSNSDAKMYTIVLDTSHSMNQAYKLRASKEAAKALLSLLGDDDIVCLITFSGDVETTQPPVRLGDKRNQLNQMIDDIKPSQGTFLGTALSRANTVMKGYSYKEKQVMLISDGKTNSYDLNPRTIAKDMKFNEIVVSTINVATVDDEPRTLLEDIATITGGNAFFMEDVEAVEDLIFAEIADEVTEAIIEKESPVYIEKMKDGLISGADGAEDDIISVPNIFGFVQTNAKLDANVVLTVDYERESSIIRVPLYAWREYGEGKVSTLTTSLSGAWTAGWSDEFKTRLLENMLSSHLPEEKIDHPYKIEVSHNGSKTTVSLTPAYLRADGRATIALTTPSGEVIENELIFDMQKYYYTFKTEEIGRYDISVNYSYDESPEGTSEDSFFNISYAPEYDMYASYSASSLHAFVNGEVKEGEAIRIENDKNKLATYEYSFVIAFLIIAMVLFIADIAIRVLKIRKKPRVKGDKK